MGRNEAPMKRGTAWRWETKHIRSAYRGAQPADVGLYSIGIRLVQNAGMAGGEAKSVYGARAEQKTGKLLSFTFPRPATRRDWRISYMK